VIVPKYVVEDPLITHTSHNRLVARVRGEFREMPGLRLTLAQASRLWHMDSATCEAVLTCLLDEGFLVRTRDGAFVALAPESTRRGPMAPAKVRRNGAA
jgi:hypothetical protein